MPIRVWSLLLNRRQQDLPNRAVSTLQEIRGTVNRLLLCQGDLLLSKSIVTVPLLKLKKDSRGNRCDCEDHYSGRQHQTTSRSVIPQQTMLDVANYTMH